jgi:DNA-binding transcriptional ArsR family regulator
MLRKSTATRVIAGTSAAGAARTARESERVRGDPLTIAWWLYSLRVMKSLDGTCSALADPTRRAILARLARGEATVMELCEPFAISQPAISRHLKVLESARLIERRVDGTKRPCRLNATGINAIEEWLSMLRTSMEANYAGSTRCWSPCRPP